MESRCEYLMYFPSGPVPDYRRYRNLPRRSHLYAGETVPLVLVVRCRAARADVEAEALVPERSLGLGWRRLAASLSALASVCPGAAPLPEAGTGPVDGADTDTDTEQRGFRDCPPLLTHSARRCLDTGCSTQTAVEEPIICNDEVIFPLSVALDKLPVGTIKAKIIVTVWKKDQEKAEVRERGYLTILQNQNPSQIFKEDQSTFKAQVSTLLTVLPPPTVQCRQLNVSGKQLTVIKVLNTSSQEEISVLDVRILPNFNASYLPMMPDGSMLLVDNVCHQSGEVTVASFHRVGAGSRGELPVGLRALEEQAFLFQLQLNQRPPQHSKEGLEVPLTAIVHWSPHNPQQVNRIYTHYRLPSIQLLRPRLVMTASCESPVSVYKRFTVKYTLLNDLQDFLAVRLVWTPESTQAGQHQGEGQQGVETALGSVICHTPLNHLGQCRKGTALTYSVAFQGLRAGLFELSQHMKLKLQFTARVGGGGGEVRPVSRKSSPGSPAVRELMERQQGGGLGRSQSFSHQQPSRAAHLMRTGSVMERRAVTPPVSSPLGRPLYLPAERSALSVDKIAKRECKVLVLEPGF
ncbi:trafficking protein particle complex subunit 14 [Amblyraja radiata]|uniref:trafficking protein particle complex subunit 14 n=1 Tax=Amblyraja radiata TaxID=386614 RepID=UPI0014024042|nr:trafficking protein particle complex subunit 14 [Amblyraja radiata]